MAEATAKRMQISIPNVVREEYEVILLRELFESEFGSALVFRGGTAIRLAYGSPRFSEDLDFTVITDIDKTKFLWFLETLSKRYPTITDVVTNEKFYTLFGLIKIKESYMERPFSLKIEVSKRRGIWRKNEDYLDIVIRSETAPLTVLAQVASLERILEEKKDAMENRKVARDLFDIWFIHQLLKRKVELRTKGYDKEAAISELHRLLPKSYWKVSDVWFE